MISLITGFFIIIMWWKFHSTCCSEPEMCRHDSIESLVDQTLIESNVHFIVWYFIRAEEHWSVIYKLHKFKIVGFSVNQSLEKSPNIFIQSIHHLIVHSSSLFEANYEYLFKKTYYFLMKTILLIQNWRCAALRMSALSMRKDEVRQC